MARPPLSPDGRRIRAIIISTPFLVASSILLYKRLVLGEEQKLIPRIPTENELLLETTRRRTHHDGEEKPV